MSVARNLRDICILEDSSYKCTLDLWDSWVGVWDEGRTYVARANDPAPVNQWVLDQIATGAYDPIEACHIPAPPVADPSDGPVVL